jgi:putative Mg2+ transporter-C (MgtC) family protein
MQIPLHEMVLKLLAALLLGGLIGLERETHGRPAGLRTHILVCMGSTLFSLCSFIVSGSHYDPARISAQIVTGIGFLGAGTIMRQGSVVRGLTTAASIWTVAAIGMAVAIGDSMYLVAIVATALVVATLNLIPHLETYLQIRHGDRMLSVTIGRDSELVCRIIGLLTERGAGVQVLGSEETRGGHAQTLRLRVRHDQEFDRNAFSALLLATEGVIGYSWD